MHHTKLTCFTLSFLHGHSLQLQGTAVNFQASRRIGCISFISVIFSTLVKMAECPLPGVTEKDQGVLALPGQNLDNCVQGTAKKQDTLRNHFLHIMDLGAESLLEKIRKFCLDESIQKCPAYGCHGHKIKVSLNVTTESQLRKILRKNPRIWEDSIDRKIRVKREKSPEVLKGKDLPFYKKSLEHSSRKRAVKLENVPPIIKTEVQLDNKPELAKSNSPKRSKSIHSIKNDGFCEEEQDKGIPKLITEDGEFDINNVSHEVEVVASVFHGYLFGDPLHKLKTNITGGYGYVKVKEEQLLDFPESGKPGEIDMNHVAQDVEVIGMKIDGFLFGNCKHDLEAIFHQHYYSEKVLVKQEPIDRLEEAKPPANEHQGLIWDALGFGNIDALVLHHRPSRS